MFPVNMLVHGGPDKFASNERRGEKPPGVRERISAERREHRKRKRAR
jgi:hypothetical protein